MVDFIENPLKKAAFETQEYVRLTMAGLRGMVSSGGVAGHGSSSPWDVHNTLIAAGPDLKEGVTIEVPSARTLSGSSPTAVVNASIVSNWSLAALSSAHHEPFGS